MTKPCPSCGATTVPGARFCRLCGAALKTTDAPDDDAPVSPHAQTIPLGDEGRSTHDFEPHQTRRPGSGTSRMDREEAERLLRAGRASSRELKKGKTGDHTATPDKSKQPERVAPQTSALATGPLAPPLASPLAPPSAVVDKSPAAPVLSQAASHSTAKAATALASPHARRSWQAAAVILFCVAIGASLLAFFFSRGPASRDAGGASPISLSDQKKLVDEQIAESRVLLASGDVSGAIERLRRAVQLDPTNAYSRMLLGDALLRAGARSEAIEEFRVVTQNDKNNTTAWRSLASAQSDEKLYADAVESYRHLISLVNEATLEDSERLKYADALRFSGHTEEARAVYQKLSTSTDENIAHAAKQNSALLPPPIVVAANAEPSNETRAASENARTVEASNSSTASGEPPVASAKTKPTANSVAQHDPDWYYFRAVNIVNGRDPKKLQRAELVTALEYFQRAQTGTHAADARQQAERLGKAYDRLKKW